MDVEWRPFELHPELPPEGAPSPPYVRASAHNAVGDRLRQMARESGREIVLGSEWMPNTRRALEAAEYAREQGKYDAFHQAIFNRIYGQGKDIGRWDVLADAAREAGLDAEEMQRRVESGQYEKVVDDQIAEAHSLGITGVPAYVIADRYLISGAQPYAVFEQVMEELGATPLAEDGGHKGNSNETDA